MSSDRPRTRALRVGVVLSETMIAEHVVRSGTAFTIGQSIRNLVPLAIAGLPRRWQLLELVEHGVLLRLAPGMGARVAAGGHVLGRADLDRAGAATRAATLVTVPAGSHGRLELGEVTVLFQELRLPLPAPAPALPRAVKGTLGDRIDRRMAAFAAASVLVHFGVMTWASVHDAPADATPAERALAQYTADTISVIDADDPILDLEPAPAPAQAQAQAAPAAPAAATPASRAVTPPSEEPRVATPARRRPAVAEPIAADPGRLREDASRAAEELFSDDRGGPLTRVMPSRRPGADLDKQLTELRDARAKVTIGTPADDRRIDGGTPRIGTAQRPIVGGDPGDVTRAQDGDKGENLRTRIEVVPQPPPVPGADLEQVIAKIRTTYMPGLQRCYKKALGGEPTLAGKVNLTFTLSEKGKVSDARARGVDDGFQACVEGLMTRWSFVPVTDEDGEPIELDVDVTLQLSI